MATQYEVPAGKTLDRPKTTLAIYGSDAYSWTKLVRFCAEREIKNRRMQVWSHADLLAAAEVFETAPVWADRIGQAPGTPGVDVATLRKMVRDEIAKQGGAGKTIHVSINGGVKNDLGTAATHGKFEEALMLAALRVPMLLVGPAGSGKSYLAEQVAKALGLRFHYAACTAGMSEGVLGGRLLPTAEGGRFEYSRSDFATCYEEGGVFLLDEMDAGDANTLVFLNNALAGDTMSLPNRVGATVAQRHPDFICIAAANTYGTGASRQYVGRNQLDEATLDRFRMGQIELHYDAGLEEKVAPHPDLLRRFRNIRKRVEETRMARVVSMRALRDAYALISRGGQSVEYCEEALVRGWTRDERTKVGMSPEPRTNLFKTPARSRATA